MEGNKFCKIYPTEADRNAKTNAGHITRTGLGLYKLVTLLGLPAHRLYLRIETLVGQKAFTAVFFSKSAEGCSLNTAKFTGTMGFVLPEPSTNEEAISHTPEPLTANDEAAEMANVQLLYGGEKVTMTIEGGKATTKLSGAFEGKKWSLTEEGGGGGC